MIPSHYECPYGWHKEYNGYIMTGDNGHEGSSMYHCVDKSLEQVQSSGECEDVHFMKTVYTTSSSCLHVTNSGTKEISCAVCTK